MFYKKIPETIDGIDTRTVKGPDAAPDDIEKEIEENRDERLSANVVYKR